jgi:hypothetical protein
MLRIVHIKNIMGIWSPVLCSDGVLEGEDEAGICSMLPSDECNYNYSTSTGLPLIRDTVSYYHVFT